ncbi:MAG: hypothetical protein LWY06_17800 [Firmicutes bacterium]|nr:hypothetical protein [Bacillota bacterium]
MAELKTTAKKPTGQTGEEKAKLFKAGFSGKTIVPLIIPMLIAAILVWYGNFNNSLFPIPDDPGRGLFVFGPMVLGAVIIIFSVLTIIDNMLISIMVTPEYILCKKGGKEMKVGWRILAFAPPLPGKKNLRTFTIGDGKQIFRVNEIFLPKFDTVVNIIKTAKNAAIKKGYDI